MGSTCLQTPRSSRRGGKAPRSNPSRSNAWVRIAAATSADEEYVLIRRCIYTAPIVFHHPRSHLLRKRQNSSRFHVDSGTHPTISPVSHAHRAARKATFVEANHARRLRRRRRQEAK